MITLCSALNVWLAFVPLPVVKLKPFVCERPTVPFVTVRLTVSTSSSKSLTLTVFVPFRNSFVSSAMVCAPGTTFTGHGFVTVMVTVRLVVNPPPSVTVTTVV